MRDANFSAGQFEIVKYTIQMVCTVCRQLNDCLSLFHSITASGALSESLKFKNDLGEHATEGTGRAFCDTLRIVII